MKLIFKIIKKFILSISILYLYNIFMQNYNIPIPINIYTIGILMIFEVPGFIGLILLFFINFR
jgi:hypothetical protein